MSQTILIVRTDRMGDVILTTPLSRALRALRPDARILWLVRPYAAPLLAQNPDIDDVLVDDGQPGSALADRLRRQHIDVALVAYPRWRTVWALWRAGIPRRIGPASKWYSVFFTDRLWQHRSRGSKHESDFNLELLAPLGLAASRQPTRFELSADERAQARVTLEARRITFRKPVVILHPGSGGSSARWPLGHFMTLGDRLQESGYDVVVTGGPGEDYQPIMTDQMRHTPTIIPPGSVTVRELGGLFSLAQLVVSNSTGPLHLAVALDVETVSIYSPIATCHPKRWGPYPAYIEGGDRHRVFVAPKNQRSEGDMAAVTVDEVFAACAEKLQRAARALNA